MEKTSMFPKSLFGSPRQSSILSSSSPSYSSSSSCSSPSSLSSSSSTNPKPQRLSFNLRGGASFPSHSPKPEGRSRSGTTVEPLTTTRKRTNTLTTTVDSLTLFWEGKKESSDNKKKEKEKEKLTKSGSFLFGKSPPKPIFKEPAKRSNDKEHASQLPTLKETKTQRDIKREISDIRTQGANVVVSLKEDKKTSKNGSSKLRTKQKAKSEGSLISVLFSKKINDRSGFLQKSSSLIELKQTSNMQQLTTKSGSSLQLGQIKRGYFGTTLQEAMVLQLEKFPELRLPVIVVKLTEAILYFHGNMVEGIFRVAGSTQQVSKLQQQLNVLNYDEMSTDPHVLVGVLKQWFRELKEPLIPNDNYQECIRCETLADSVRAVGNLPPLNKATFEHLVIFLRQLSKPENQKYTKMDLHSLCVVSAPMLFRCPTTDMTELMVNMQKEKSFLSLVLESSAFCC